MLKIESKKIPSIAIFTPYFGRWPNWFDYFLKSCEYNPTIDWIFYTDCEKPKNYPANVSFFSGTLADFNHLASAKLGMEIDARRTLKVCDYRPAFGHIFEDYLDSYDFWGYGDLDVIYGNLRKFFTPELLENNDVLTVTSAYLAGYLTLFSKQMKFLYLSHPDYKKVFTDNLTHYNFEETNFVWEENLKRGEAGANGVAGMTQFVKKMAQAGKLRLAANYWRSSDYNFPSKVEIIFDKGKLFDRVADREVALYHFIETKKILFLHSIYMPIYDGTENLDYFMVTKYGIQHQNRIPFLKKIIIDIIWKIHPVRLEIDRRIGLVGIFLKKHAPRLYKMVKPLTRLIAS